MNPLVLNKHCCGNPPDSAYIGRGSKWGNPFVIGKDGDRATVIAKHAAWLREQPHLIAALDELRGKHLICFCAPAACHGDLLLRLANANQADRAFILTPSATGGREPDPAHQPAREGGDNVPS